jgi:hypothetical protein
MLEELLQIQSSCLSEGALRTAQLVNELMAKTLMDDFMAQAMASTAKAPAPRPAKKHTRDQKENERLVHCETIRRLFTEMRRSLDISGHKLANQIGYASQSNIPGLRTRDAGKEYVATIHHAQLVKIFGPEILAKDTPSLGE